MTTAEERSMAAEHPEEWYEAYYARKGGNRNNIVRDAGARWQSFFSDIGYLDALTFVVRAGNLDERLREVRALDVGCGSGSSCMPLLQVGIHPGNIVGVDVQADRIAEGRERFPWLDLRIADASKLDIETGTFDIVCESTMFVAVTNEALAHGIAAEMIRITKPDGYLVLRDWTTALGRASTSYAPLTRKRLQQLFGVGTMTRVVARKRGALLPPLGRWLGRHAPSLYQSLQRLPFATGQHVIVLQRL